ncbi:MAG: hypothetical protein ACLRXQ_12875 [Phascolarctobacterium faecium]
MTKHNDYGDTWFELGWAAHQDQQDGQLLWRRTRGFGGDINKSGASTPG